MINVALGFDEKFAQHAYVTIYSALKNTKMPINFFLMCSNLKDSTKNKLETLISLNNSSLHWVDIKGKFDKIFTGYLSEATYYRIVIPDVCDVDKILYLDSDILVTGDLSELFNIDLGDFPLGAVHDFGIEHLAQKNVRLDLGGARMSPAKYFYEYRNWTENQIAQYFNAGVLLMNLAKLREIDFCTKAIDALGKEKYAFMDQDCLNSFFLDNYLKLPISCNFMIIENWNDAGKLLENEEFNEFKDGQKLPLIIHYVSKPWHLKISSLFYAKLYYSYKFKTPWKFSLEFKPLIKQVFRCKLGKKTRYLNIFGKDIIKPVYED